ncbi:MAG: hypothetical protein IKZ34_02465, partial [Alphaproteobacteria bacterium]|nr:hypothetical protein [Alphaproteobacteria bacterium]
VQAYCEPVGENYWSESVENLLGTDLESGELYMRALGRTACPENSSTRGDTTAQYCTCDDGYTVTGTVGGSIQTTTNACIKFMCEDGYYQNGNTCEICPAGYACSGGVRTAYTGNTYSNDGQSVCTTCPTSPNTIGAAVINTNAHMDLNDNNLHDSVNECGVLYMFVEDFVASNGGLSTDILDTYNPDSDANKRGNGYVYCAYNTDTDEYDLNCWGHPLYCAGGHYSSGWNSDEHTNKTETDKLPIYETATLDEFVQVYCEPVGEDYYSLSVSAFVDENGEPTDDYIYEEAINSLLSRTACPENSSTNGSTTATSCTCNDGYTLTGTIGGNVQTTIDACRPIPEFTITTTDMPADTLFEFMISAAGDYTIDWGDGNIEFISIPTPAVTMISHTYTESGVRTIGIAGDATSYNTDEDFKYAVISFTDEYYVSKMRGTAFNYIAKIEGSLGDIFSGSAQNMFANTFGKCENLTEIPGDLFKGVSGAANDMFRGTFAGCTSLETIPMGLFSGATGAADSMFENVFSGCTGLQSLPEDLFASVVYEDASKDVTRLFTAAFIGCTGLTELPANLFSGIKVAGPQMFNATFANCSSLKTIYSGLFGNIAGSANSQYVLTFANCSSLSEIPEGLFASFSDDGENDNSAGVFYGTFGMCASLNKIPENLFENVTRATQNMFLSTFAGCEKLSNIPEKLFANIEGKPAEHSFANTFAGCTGLTGYVPATLFEKMDSTDYEAGPMTGIFEGTNYDTQCPVNNYQYKTGFEADWSGKVACTMCPDGYLSDAGSTAETQCYIPCEKQCKPQTCPENASCVQGEITTTSGKQFYGSVCDVEDKWCDITINCNNGYHQENGGISILEKTPLIPVEYHVAGEGFAVVDGIGNATNKNLPDAGLTENNTWAMRFDYGTVYGRASCQPSIDAEYEYVMYNVENVLEGEMSVEEFETGLVAISDASKAKYTTDILREVLAGTKDIVALYEPLFVIYGVNENANYKTTDTGAYCNCQMTDFAPTGGTKQSVAGTNWVSLMFFENAEGCSESCSSVCAAFMIDSEFASLRAAIYDALYVDYSKNMCVANIIDVPAGYYLPANTIEPVLCPTNSYCPGMTGITIHELQDQGLFPCPDSTSSVAGSSMLAQCVGQRTLHIGDDITMNLTTVRPTTERVMVFDVLGELYYGSLSDTEKTVTSETDKQFRIFDGAKDYWLHDYTVQ